MKSNPLQEVFNSLDLKAKEFLTKTLLPKLNCGVIRRCVLKAIRLGVWRFISPESRALLRALTFWRGVIRSESLKRVVRELLLYIELNTIRGSAILYGLLITLRKESKAVVDSVDKLLLLGISYLNNPPIFRFLDR